MKILRESNRCEQIDRTYRIHSKSRSLNNVRKCNRDDGTRQISIFELIEKNVANHNQALKLNQMKNNVV